jgi:carboxylesterase type B
MEGTLFTASQFTSPASITETDYTTFLQSNFGPLASLVALYYPLSLFATTPFPAFYAISTVITYNAYFCPTRLALLATLNSSVPVWNYYDAHTPACGWEPGLGGPSLQLLGPTHTSEIPFVFGQLTNLPLPNGTCSFNVQEVAISKVLTSAWTSMAETGSPDGGIGVLGGPWPRWNGTGSQGLLIGNASAIGYINYTICDFWDKIEALSLNASMSANGTSVANASSSTSARSTSTGSIATATGDGTIVRTTFSGFVFIALAVVFAVLLLAF